MTLAMRFFVEYSMLYNLDATVYEDLCAPAEPRRRSLLAARHLG